MSEGRAILLVMDSVGIGASADAPLYGDEGSDTLGHVAEACGRAGMTLKIPHLTRLGLGEAARLSTGRLPPGLERSEPPTGRYGFGIETSKGKDTPSGHWELAGLPVAFDWGYFPTTVPCFPDSLTEALIAQGDLPGILGNRHASGTEIIADLGEEHQRTGKPIVYTSADSVLQIAAHETSFGLARLLKLCELARELCNPLKIGRVIARPFIGTKASGFTRTANRHDYAVPPPGETLLSLASGADRHVITVGKIGDIFAHRGTGDERRADGNMALFDETLLAVDALRPGGLLFANFIDFDSLYGHRRDPLGYGQALEAFDRRLPALFARLRPSDILIITADHGCDPTFKGTDHTREHVPILATGGALTAGPMGPRGFSDVAATIAEHLSLRGGLAGVSFQA